jgi:alpha-beta hydrolase superfamily lysophospholipase
MVEGSVNAWINDLAEAIAIGRLIGERVVVIAVSTGGSLAAWAATQPALMEDVAGIVLISPNFALVNKQAAILSLPWGGTLAELVAGKERSFETFSEAHRTFWTYRYPTRALLPMKAAVDLAAAQDYGKVTIPALFVFRPDDQVVDEAVTAQIADRWGGSKEVFSPENAEDPYKHVIAGDALSPSATGPVAEKITAWAKAL